VQQQIKAQEQTVAREAEVNNRCADMEKTAKDAQDKNHKYELKLCEKQWEIRELKLQCEVRAAQSSQSRAEDDLRTTQESLKVEEGKTKEAANEIQKEREALLQTSIAHRDEVGKLKNQVTRIDNSLQQATEDFGRFKKVTQSEKRYLRAKVFLLIWRFITAEAKLAKRTNNLRQADESVRQLEETLLSERRHSRKKVGFLRWRSVTAEAKLAKRTNDLRQADEFLRSERYHSRKKVSFLR
jgi:hypothetical protein